MANSCDHSGSLCCQRLDLTRLRRTYVHAWDQGMVQGAAAAHLPRCSFGRSYRNVVAHAPYRCAVGGGRSPS